jgi:hypothetical protein
MIKNATKAVMRIIFMTRRVSRLGSNLLISKLKLIGYGQARKQGLASATGEDSQEARA